MQGKWLSQDLVEVLLCRRIVRYSELICKDAKIEFFKKCKNYKINTSNTWKLQHQVELGEEQKEQHDINTTIN